MRIRKGEKWYGGILFAILVGLMIGMSLREQGIEATINGQTKILSKGISALINFVAWLIFSLGFWFVLKYGFGKADDFVCKYCGKEGSKNMETQKEVCKNCYKKRERY